MPPKSSPKTQDTKEKKLTRSKAPLVIIICVVFSVISLSIAGIYVILRQFEIIPDDTVTADIAQFDSEAEFLDYITQSGDISDSRVGAPTESLEAAAEDSAGFGAGGAAPEATRASETNVQVRGIDEPDVVKTDGENIYYSQEEQYYWIDDALIEDEDDTTVELGTEESSSVRPSSEAETKLITAFPPADLAELSDINMTGDLLLKDDTLVVLSYDAITGYDISDASNPQEEWEIEYDSNTSLFDARQYDDTLYVVTSTYLNTSDPCPIVPLKSDGREISIACTDIYHPTLPSSVDATYSVFAIDLETGKVSRDVTFVGSAYYSVVYMSTKYLYITYNYQPDLVDVFIDFMDGSKGIFDSEIKAKIEELNDYDLSSYAKQIELMYRLDNYFASFDEDEQEKKTEDMSNQFEEYVNENKRELGGTGIVKINVSNLKIEDTGSVPGMPLNQFSLDEYEGNLRIATTVGETMPGFGYLIGWTDTESANDVYVLDENLEQIGEIVDLGLDERIYSARFIGDLGYVVTFREVDPFYVIDLSNPQRPRLEGELKIPGFSSYLHPIDENLIVGVGEEDWNVKISLFNVSNSREPLEVDKYEIDEYWSDVSETHHAFLMDTKHGIFFMPAGDDGYIFSYAGENLELVKVVTGARAERAVFIDDYLYVIGSNGIVVLDENSWERVNELEF